MKVRIILGIVLMAALALVPSPAHADATSTITATSVALSSYSTCTSPGGLDLGMAANTITREGGIASDISGDLMTFDQSSGFTNYNGVFTGFNFSSPAWSVDDGAVVALYAYIGTPTYDATNTAEWFMLYQCHTGGPSTVLRSCFGGYGTCPQTAREALVPDLNPIEASVDAGGLLTVSGTGCWTTTAFATLTADSGTPSSLTGIVVAADGTFSGDLKVSDDAGGPATLEVGCGTPSAQDADGVASASLSVVPLVAPTTTAAPTTTTTAAPVVEATPAFTG